MGGLWRRLKLRSRKPVPVAVLDQYRQYREVTIRIRGLKLRELEALGDWLGEDDYAELTMMAIRCLMARSGMPPVE